MTTASAALYLPAVPWPRYPLETAAGKPSRAKTAGKRIPWLSINAVNGLHPQVYRSLRARWRAAAEGALALAHSDATPTWPGRSLLVVTLYRATNQPMDPTAVVEGAKPIIDGLVDAGVLPGDDERYLAGVLGVAHRAGTPALCRVELELRPYP